MLTIFKQIFVWWNQQTLGTRMYTFFYGKLVVEDQLGNKYYENKKKNKRWVIYGGEIDASKISNEWYSWMHFTKNKIENLHKIEKYNWQKPHQSNKTGSKDAYRPDKNNKETKKKYTSWKE